MGFFTPRAADIPHDPTHARGDLTDRHNGRIQQGRSLAKSSVCRWCLDPLDYLRRVDTLTVVRDMFTCPKCDTPDVTGAAIAATIAPTV